MKATLISLFLLAATCIHAQDNSRRALYEELRKMDSVLFEYAFKQCDTLRLKPMLAEDLEFYHDQSGITNGRAAFISSVPNMCGLSYKPIRKLLSDSMEVHPLFRNGELYGAVQTGVHEFYAKDGNLPVYLTSTAKFTHLWLLTDGTWKLKRVLSYDHVVPR